MCSFTYKHLWLYACACIHKSYTWPTQTCTEIRYDTSTFAALQRSYVAFSGSAIHSESVHVCVCMCVCICSCTRSCENACMCHIKMCWYVCFQISCAHDFRNWLLVHGLKRHLERHLVHILSACGYVYVHMYICDNLSSLRTVCYVFKKLHTCVYNMHSFIHTFHTHIHTCVLKIHTRVSNNHTCVYKHAYVRYA